MDLRHLTTGLSPADRIEARRKQIEDELGVDLGAVQADPAKIGTAEDKNCEQMFGHVALPVGLAGPIALSLSSGEVIHPYFPLATTEAALVASTNRGCKAITQSDGAQTISTYHGATRTLAFRHRSGERNLPAEIRKLEREWKQVAEGTSSHIKLLTYDIDLRDGHVFVTLACDTDEAMGMNMVTIAAQAVGEWMAENLGLEFITVAGNIESDKKASRRTHDRGRGYEVTASVLLKPEVIASVLKSSPKRLLNVAHAKLTLGSDIAGALGRNLHAANVIAALYLATGQDAAHVVEGSLADTVVSEELDGIRVRVRIPALMVGIRGGGTALPGQSECLKLLLREQTSLHPSRQLAESMAAAILAGEVSLLAAQASHALARAHAELAR